MIKMIQYVTWFKDGWEYLADVCHQPCIGCKELVEFKRRAVRPPGSPARRPFPEVGTKVKTMAGVTFWTAGK